QRSRPRMSAPKFVVRPFDPARARRTGVFVALAWLGSLLVVAATTVFLLGRHQPATEKPAVGDSEEVQALKTRIVVLERSEQVAKAALVDLQGTLRDREEE